MFPDRWRRRLGVPWRSSLLARLLAVSAVVSICSVAAVAWLAVRTTTRAIQQEQSQALTDDARIYDTLLGFAATHHDWSGVGPVVAELSRSTGHRIVLTGPADQPIADSAGGRDPVPGKASATIDPLAVDEDTADDRIDPRAVGPFRLPSAERRELSAAAERLRSCLRAPPITPAPAPAGSATRALIRDAEIVREPSGRPRVASSGSVIRGEQACVRQRAVLAEPTATEKKALRQLDDLTNACLRRRGVPTVQVGLGGSWVWADAVSERAGDQRRAAVGACLAGARREQLSPYVAPVASLYVTTPRAAAPASGFDLSTANRVRIIGASAIVLIVTFGLTVFAGVRLVRPLHALTGAAQRMRDGDASARVTVAGPDEIARLGAAFNDMSERRQQVEDLRRAMVSDIAHEMRTPVTNIRGWLEAAEDGVVPLDRELMSSLLEEALLLQHVIEDLQDLSAADAGELRLHPQPVDLAEVLAHVVAAQGAAAERGGVRLRANVPAALTVAADPIRLRQAVGNLVANAIRHTPPGGRVTVTGRAEQQEGQRWMVVDVTDTGNGIAPADLPLVFERFWRAEKSRNRNTGGSGLGLSIVRKLAEAHGGTVSAASRLGEGSTFSVRLPAP